jgi:hypothetical protein
MQQRRDELVARAWPPEGLFEQVSADNVRLGAGLNKASGSAFRMGKDSYGTVLERAKAQAADYLAHFPPERRRGILLGALASVYSKEGGGSDTAVWLAGGDEAGQESVAHQTIVVLRELGLLDEIIETKEGLVVYPARLDKEEAE